LGFGVRGGPFVGAAGHPKNVAWGPAGAGGGGGGGPNISWSGPRPRSQTRGKKKLGRPPGNGHAAVGDFPRAFCTSGNRPGPRRGGGTVRRGGFFLNCLSGGKPLGGRGGGWGGTGKGNSSGGTEWAGRCRVCDGVGPHRGKAEPRGRQRGDMGPKGRGLNGGRGPPAKGGGGGWVRRRHLCGHGGPGGKKRGGGAVGGHSAGEVNPVSGLLDPRWGQYTQERAVAHSKNLPGRKGGAPEGPPTYGGGPHPGTRRGSKPQNRPGGGARPAVGAGQRARGGGKKSSGGGGGKNRPQCDFRKKARMEEKQRY